MWRHDIDPNDISLNGINHETYLIHISYTFLFYDVYNYVECHYAQCHYTECCGTFETPSIKQNNLSFRHQENSK